jgi:hypothetical protein
LFRRLDGMGLQAVLPDAFGIGVAGLHRQKAGHPKLHRLFHDEIGAGLLDRREEQPKVGRQVQRPGPGLTGGHRPAPGGKGKLRQPFAVAPVEEMHRVAHGQPHDSGQVMRLVRRQGHGLPRGQWVVYMKPDPGHGVTL